MDENIRIELIKYLPPLDSKAPIIEIRGRYVILAQNRDDLATKAYKLERGDVDGFCKTKAFVVTEDIKEGDEAIYLPSLEKRIFNKFDVAHHELWKKTNIQEKVKKEAEDWVGGEWYKILGEASPFATFVKDGEKYEVKELPACHFNNNITLCCYPDCPCMEDEFKRYDIKCPCCGDFK